LRELQIELNRSARRLARVLVEQGSSVTTAESCTGGLVSATLTGVAGSSDWFSCAWVTYSNDAKNQLLGVPKPLLEAHGAVSQQVVEAMASGARERAGSTLAVAISGIAGPGGGSPEKPVGTVWIGWSSPVLCDSECFQFAGDRETVRIRSVHAAIMGLEARCGKG